VLNLSLPNPFDRFPFGLLTMKLIAEKLIAEKLGVSKAELADRVRAQAPLS
jgi:hypothetical protein